MQKNKYFNFKHPSMKHILFFYRYLNGGMKFGAFLSYRMGGLKGGEARAKALTPD